MRALFAVVVFAGLLVAGGCQTPPTPVVFRDDFRHGMVTEDTDLGGDGRWYEAAGRPAQPAGAKPGR
jgi:hypothetical protein